MDFEENQREFKGVWIPREIWLDSRLNALDKVIFAEIDSYSNLDKGCFASNERLANFCQCSESKVSKTISKLIEFGYVRRISFDGRKRFLQSCLVKNATLKSTNCYPESQKMPDTNIYNKPVINTQSNIYCHEPPKQTAMNESFYDSCSQSEPCVSSGKVKKQSNADKIKEIINYLNQRTGQNYKPTTKDTIGMINARLKEGFTVQDFVKVVDSKVFEWKDTEWEQYLRPKTLFSTKFESYLQAANLPCKPKKQQGNGGYRQEPKQTITSEWDRVREEKKKQTAEGTYIPDPWEEI